MRWRGEQAKLVRSQTYSPRPINTDLSVLKVILKHARIELSANTAADIPSLDVSQHRPYARVEPNGHCQNEPRLPRCYRSLSW
jgi:hypothetical protein